MLSVGTERRTVLPFTSNKGRAAETRPPVAMVEPDALPVPMLLMSKEGFTVLEANMAARTMFGRRGTDIGAYLETALPADVRVRLIGACAGMEVLTDYPLELRPRGRRVRLQLSVTPAVGDYAGSAVWLVMRDITDTHDVDLWQLRYQTLVQALFSELPYPGWILDNDNRVLFHNRSYLELPDCLRGQVEEPATAATPSTCHCTREQAATAVSSHDWQGLAAQVRRTGRMEQRELHLGSCGRWQLLMFPLPGDRETLHVGALALRRGPAAATQFSSSEPSLGAIAQGLQEVRQQERGAIAREIHDNLGQEITLLLLEIDRVLGLKRHKPNRDEHLYEKLVAVQEHAQHIMQVTRRLAYQMRQVTVDSKGLAAAAADYVVNYRRRSNLQGQLEVMEGWQEPGVEMAQHLFRSLQELLNNVAKHSGATRFAVRMGRDEEGYWLEVQDNGHGLPRRVQEGAGLRSLRERAAIYGGRVEVHTRPAIQGTTVWVMMPTSVKI